MDYLLWALVGGLMLALGIYVGSRWGPRLEGAKPPWRLGTLGIIMVTIGAALVVVIAVADTILSLSGHPEGLPEVVGTSVFGVANIIVGYGGACLTARTEGSG